jgi:hypothetical protein
MTSTRKGISEVNPLNFGGEVGRLGWPGPGVFGGLVHVVALMEASGLGVLAEQVLPAARWQGLAVPALFCVNLRF